MSLISFKILRDWDTGIPVSFSKSQMIGVDEVFDLIFDGSGMDGDVVFGKELFLSIIVDFIVFDGADFGRFMFFNVE